MQSYSLRTMSGNTTALGRRTVEAFTEDIGGEVVAPEGPGYDDTRAVWNAMVDRRPGLIVRCRDAADVVRAVRLAREHELLISVRGVGHNIAGNAVCDGGLMIDLSLMKSVRVDPERRTVRVEPGVTLGELDRQTQEHGLATPTGINSTTGIAGLTVGGGFGWLSRKHGLTIDNLLAADVVTATGERVRASEEENRDLFWGIRGGGGNFGIVTEFEFRLHEIGPEILSGLIVHPGEDAERVLSVYRDFTLQAPDELTVWAVLRKAPPLPFLPAEVHGTDVVILAAMYAGDLAAGEKALAPLRAAGEPLADVIGPHRFTDWQAAFDPLLTEGFRNYWKSHDFLRLEDRALDTIRTFAGSLPSPHCEIFIAQMGGATSRVPAEATAYRHRDAQYIMNLHGRWEAASEDERCIAWCREVFNGMAPFATGGVYVNFMTEEEDERVREAYGDSYDRLARLKRKYDPRNMFRLNQNIRPAAQAEA
jgi:FAD/FMN-containing dehydrogenase